MKRLSKHFTIYLGPEGPSGSELFTVHRDSSWVSHSETQSAFFADLYVLLAIMQLAVKIWFKVA